MEGGWRGVAWVATALASTALTVAASGCGDGGSGAPSPAGVRTADPARTFAPLVEVAAGEPWRPMSARWLIERSSFWLAEDRCPDRKIAVGHTLPEQQNARTDWIYPKGLGGWSWPAYYRNPYDASCELDFDHRLYADQLTRPHDPGPRVDGLRPGQGYYLDLIDGARRGPDRGAAVVPAYVERVDERDTGVRLSYWVLFGMHGRPGERDAHEGDWERLDVILRADGDRYEPRAVRARGQAGEWSWNATRRVARTHPVVMAARATHALTAARPGADCASCDGWKTWESLADARKEVWHGFGGAWGEPGSTDATTGSLGPHDRWPSAAEKERDAGAPLGDG